MSNFYFEKIKRIQALSEIGLEMSQNIYDIERYQELREISLQMLERMTDVPIEKIVPVIEENNGYKTPKVDVRAAIFNEKNQILLVREIADNNWAMPGGWTDINYSPGEVAEKECLEEAGIKIKAVKLLAVLDKQKQNMPPAFEYVYKIFLLCEKLNDNLKAGSEIHDVGWFDENDLPTLSLPRNLPEHIKLMFKFKRGEITEPIFD